MKKNKLTRIVASVVIPIITVLSGCDFNRNVISTDSTKKTASKFTRFYEAGPNAISDEAFHMYTSEYTRNFKPKDFNKDNYFEQRQK